MRKLRRIALLLLLAACGSRTGLLTDDEAVDTLLDGSTDAADASKGDETTEIADALPPLDVQPNPDVVRTDCPDAGATLIYVVTEMNELYSFFPTDGTFTLIGNLRCPTSRPDANPFSMAVDRAGVAFVVFDDGELFRVSTATGACAETSFNAGQLGIETFGMGYSTDLLGPTETLYIASDSVPGQNNPNPPPTSLGSINTTSFALSVIAPFNPTIVQGELTGTGDGRLFSFYTKSAMGTDSYIGEINKTNGNVIAETPLPGVDQGGGWAFGFWGGDFYTFTSPDFATSVVQRYRPSDGSIVTIASLPSIVVGAGVSTCAPQQ